MSPHITVLLVDDHAVVRRGLEQLLNSHADITVVGQAGDGETAVALEPELRPDVVLMDLSMPGIGGTEATRRIVAARPEARVVALTSFSEQRRVLDVLQAGATGYLLKDSDPDDVLAAIRAAAAGGAPLHPTAARALLDSRRAPTEQRLSGRETEVLRLVVDGLANKQIARRLGITERTVKAHLTRVFTVLGVADRTQAALWGQENLRPS